MKYLIGIVGENGAGKGTVSSIIKKLGGEKVSVIKFSDILFKTLKLWNLPTTRKNLQNLAITMNKMYGDGTLTRATEARIKNIETDVVILEGVRWLSDAKMIRTFPNSFILYVTANPKVRYERMKVRGEKIGEKDKTYQQFLAEEKAGTEIEIKNIGRKADFKFENKGDLKDLEDQIKSFYKKIK